MVSWRAFPDPAPAADHVRLAKLKLAGFKTFVDPTTVLTPGNLVGVVGPNGCGKSNIIDAVRWVLGEMRASALRGESMHDVIFNGSTTRKPVQRASVELVFDNTEGRAAGAWSRYAEISVKRVLDRSGESSYHINNTQVRRKDVIDLFLGTGLGPRAYAIIEQGMISRIIEARPEDIRGFLEEAAGVTKYRERRKETEGRLSDARDNLARLEDIRGELGERIGHLREQARVAGRYRELHAAHEQRQQLLWLLKLTQARDEQTRAEQELAVTSSRLEADSARLAELEAAVEAARDQHQERTEATQEAQAALFAASAEASRLDSELRHLNDTRTRLEQRLGELAASLADWQARQHSAVQDGERWRELLDNAAMRVEHAAARHAEIADRLPGIEAERSAADAAVAEARRELAHTEQRLRVEETNRANARRALDQLAQRRSRLEDESGRIEGPDAASIARDEAVVEQLEQQLADVQQAQAEHQARWPDAQAALKQAIEREQLARRSLTEHRARREALAQLQARVQTSGKLGDWLEKHGLASLEPLWRRIDVEAGWERPAEAVLRERLAALTGATADHAATVLGDLPPGSLALAFGDDADTSILPPPDSSARPFASLIRSADASIAALLGDWLNGIFAVDSLAPWLERRATLPAGCTLVDREGRCLSRNALVSHVPDDRTHGVIERQREIDALDTRIETLQHEADAAHEAVAGSEQHAAALQEALNALRRDAQALQQQLHAAQVELLKLVQAGERAAERRAQIGHDLAELERLESAEREHVSRADTEHSRCAELAAIQHERLQTALEVLTEREQGLREIRVLEQSAARDEQEARFSQRECAAKQEEAARAAALAAEQIARISAETGTHEETLAATDVSRCEAALQQALEARSTREAALAACRDAQEDAAARLRAFEEQRLSCEHAAAPLRERIGELRLAVQAASLAAAQFDERLVEANADVETLRPLLAEDLREAQLTREVTRLAREIEELGPVNLAALEEVTAAEERRGYLDAQNDDLTEAIGTLEDAIRRIDRETREQLRQTYDTVNRHFGEVFPKLFGGGQAALVMTGEEILDAGIQIVAQPPGKKNSSIHLLSGGEKALTAIALVFSMFQLNPAPFCMLDEVDAPLDDANTERYCNMVRRMSAQTQFVFISHSKITMEIAEQLVGVTMQEQGVSRVVEVDIEAALRLAEPAAA